MAYKSLKLKNIASTPTLTLLAFILFVPLFVTRGLGFLDFWWWLSANLIILISTAAFLDPPWRASILQDLSGDLRFKIGMGILSALLLYVFFAIGNLLSRSIFSFAESGIQDVYAFKMSASRFRIAVLMIFIIGPGEEIFWRGFLQRSLQNQTSKYLGFILATGFYTLVHLGSGNIMLVLAAGVCGLFWGYLYLRYGSITLNIVSHTLWDVAVFLWFPFNT
jgi:membrane protease YdiL (CAAX protease family)